MKYAKKFAEKKEQDFITVGVIGMSNIGKSSLVNTLRDKPLCASSSTPFTTRAIQSVKLNKMILLLDSPGIMLQKSDDATDTQIIRSAVQVDELIDPVSMIPDLIKKFEKTEILRHYRIANYTSTEQMLTLIAKKKGLGPTLTGLKDAARRVFRDFLNNRLTYYTNI